MRIHYKDDLRNSFLTTRENDVLAIFAMDMCFNVCKFYVCVGQERK